MQSLIPIGFPPIVFGAYQQISIIHPVSKTQNAYVVKLRLHILGHFVFWQFQVKLCP